jgi:vancomycin resistance protein YoaR
MPFPAVQKTNSSVTIRKMLFKHRQIRAVAQAKAHSIASFQEDDSMEDNRRQPNQPQEEQGYSEVILEPIQDIGLPKKKKSSSSLARKRKKRKQQQRMIIILGSVFAVLLAFFLFMFIRNQQIAAAEAAAQIAAEEAARAQQEKEQAEFQAIVYSDKILQGVTINGVSVGGMTAEQAKNALLPVEQSLTSSRQMQLVYDNKLFPLDLSNMPYTVDTDAVIKEAFDLVKTAIDYTTLMSLVQDVQTNGRALTLSVSYDLTTLNTAVTQIASQIDIPAQDAQVTGVDKDTHQLTFKNEVVGYVVDQPALINLIADAVKTGSTTPINIPITVTQPTLTAAALQGQFVLRASATTDFSTSTSERKYNVRKGAGLINGTVLKPGDVFSTNDTLGVRSTGNGWKMANAYESGAVVPQAGGGVCQLSTTLYNAIVKGDLEVVYRRNHSMPVHYIKEGLDATINSVGNIIDFQFKNNTTSDIVIIGYTSGNKLTFEVWGIPFATTEYDEIKLTSALVSTQDTAGEPVQIEVPVGTEKADGSLMVAGETYVAVTPRKGYVYQSYKNYYLAGTLVRKEKLAVSTYKAFQGEIWICPAEETPIPEITPDPFVTDTSTPTTSP